MLEAPQKRASNEERSESPQQPADQAHHADASQDQSCRSTRGIRLGVRKSLEPSVRLGSQVVHGALVPVVEELQESTARHQPHTTPAR